MHENLGQRDVSKTDTCHFWARNPNYQYETTEFALLLHGDWQCYDIITTITTQAFLLQIGRGSAHQNHSDYSEFIAKQIFISYAITNQPVVAS